MTRNTGKTEDCTKSDARNRLAQAEMYAEVAGMVLGENDGASLSVADGTRWRGQKHSDAVKHLEKVTANPTLAGLLREVLEDKDAAHYGLNNVRLSKAKSAVRKATQLVEAAKALIR